MSEQELYVYLFCPMANAQTQRMIRLQGKGAECHVVP